MYITQVYKNASSLYQDHKEKRFFKLNLVQLLCQFLLFTAVKAKKSLGNLAELCLEEINSQQFNHREV